MTATEARILTEKSCEKFYEKAKFAIQAMAEAGSSSATLSIYNVENIQPAIDRLINEGYEIDLSVKHYLEIKW